MFRRGKDEEGAVTVFLIMVLAFVFAFVAIFIDYARVATLHVQTEKVLHAALRSVMSAYDPALQRQYGLFAYGEGTGDRIMTKVLNDSAKRTPREGSLALMNSRLDSSSLSMERKLGAYDIFNNQVREEMKYKAPVDFTFEILEKLKPVSQNMKEAAHTVDLLKRLQKLYEKREARLDSMLRKQREAAESAGNLRKLIMENGSNYIDDAQDVDKPETAEEAAAQYNPYLDLYEDNKKNPSLRKELALQGYRTKVSRLRSDIAKEMDKILIKHSSLLQEAETELNEAEKINAEMKQVIAEYKERAANAAYDEVSRAQTSGGSAGSADGTIASARQQAEDLLTPDSVFQSLRSGIREQELVINAVNSKVKIMNSGLANISARTEDADSLKNKVIRARSALDEYLKGYVHQGDDNKLTQAQNLLESRRGSDAERKQLEKQSQNKLREAYQIVEMLSSLTQGNEEFNELEQYYLESLQFNEASAEAGTPAGISYDSYDAVGGAMDSMDGMYGSTAGLLNKLGDEFFQNEYALSRFEHVDFSRFGGLIGPNKTVGNASEILGDQLQVNGQEVEYILYGFHNPAGNLAAAYGEIFGMRLAIRTMEGLVKNSSKGNPLLVLAAAVLYGVEKAVEDMIMLAQKGFVPLSEYINFKMTYKDHLRLFLMLHSNNERKMSRMLALIRFNTGVNPAERDTYASGEVRSGIRLWFLPGVMKMLGTASGEGEEIEKGVFYVTKQAVFSY
ncbi:hypothetical protein ACE41H_09200 [Paenibacillus enshidis]|uniref:Flp pilus-assembly TadG-like N-terminal domain-containing protein n=1 Tax=Paenibacillus enshidis TaxID=1458439 RepID=A0ABV5AU95_9BACL